MIYYYKEHVAKAGLNTGRFSNGLFGGGIVNYTKDGIALFANYGSQAIWKTYQFVGKQPGWMINMKHLGAGKGLFDELGRIIFFVYF